MYRIALKTVKGLKIGINQLTLEKARAKKNFLNQRKGTHCIIITEEYFLGKEDFKEVI